MKILIVGGVAGGATAISRLRRLDEKAEIILFERGKYVSFANCGLPYYIGGTIERRESLFVTTPEAIIGKYGVDVRVENEVLSIDTENKKVLVLNHKTNERYEETYDKILLSTGSRPFVPSVDGINENNVFHLWTIPDVDDIQKFITENDPKKAVVVGGGFIGLEMVENLIERGIEVTLIEMASQVMPPLDIDMAKLIENYLHQKGVTVLLNEAFYGTENNGKTIRLSSGKRIETEFTILSIGVRPNNELAQGADLALNQKGGVQVNEFMQTSNPDIYAVGDVIGVEDYIFGGEIMVPLAGPANKQGRAVAANILGLEPESYRGTMGTSIAKVFDLTVASVGANEKTLEQKGQIYKKDYFVSLIHPMNHAGYYPGALPMTIKLIFANDGKVLGAQIVGYEGVDKRIDTIATTIHFHGSVSDLTELELAYAPPYSNAKDPVNFAGYVAENILKGLTDPVLYREWLEHPDEYQFLDIRENPEIVVGSLYNAKHIPLTELRGRLFELSKDVHYLTFCTVGLRGYIAERVLKQNGFKASNLLGGYRSVMDLESKAMPKVSTEQDKLPEEPKENITSFEKRVLNVCGLSCPGPIVEVSREMEELEEGQILRVTATDPGFARDIQSWCQNTGNQLLSQTEEKGTFTATILKGSASEESTKDSLLTVTGPDEIRSKTKEKTMIIFDGDLDKAIAAFIIATGAAAMGNKVHMFFTFWGLSIIRKEHAPKVKKDFMGKMFGFMLPKSSKKLSLSQMNFAGAGPKMIRSLMKKHGVSSLEELIKQAIDMGVELTACQMSMDLMGLKKEELIDGVAIGGVASMLNDNDNSNMNLFI